MKPKRILLITKFPMWIAGRFWRDTQRAFFDMYEAFKDFCFNLIVLLFRPVYLAVEFIIRLVLMCLPRKILEKKMGWFFEYFQIGYKEDKEVKNDKGNPANISP